jgi:Zn-dependent metalloprotease
MIRLLVTAPCALLLHALWAGVLLLSVSPAHAVRGGDHAVSDAQRFGLNQSPTSRSRLGTDGITHSAISRFNSGPTANLRFGGTGLSDSSAGAARVSAEAVARRFLTENSRELGVDPSQLRLELARSAGNLHHLMFVQVYEGVTVEFARVKVHMREDGRIISLESNVQASLPSPVPAIGEMQAAQAVSADLASLAPSGGRLVYYPRPNSDDVRLAWKFRAGGARASWLYYIDAATGEVLFRYNDIRFQACQTSGTILGQVYDVDPSSTPGPSLRGMPHQEIYVVDETNVSSTNANGFYCSVVPGRIFTQLQGPFVHVSHFNGPSVHYDNGGGTWATFSSPVSSLHPYANNSVVISTINAPAGAVKVLPQFSTFDVGVFDAVFGDIVDDDQVGILNAAGDLVATYVGSKGIFRGAAVPGTQLRLRLKTNASGVRNGFDVNISSYLTLNPAIKFTPDNATSSFTWTNLMSHDQSHDEVNLFYQLNLMHDYFDQGVNHSTQAFIDKPVAAMARVGPNLANAYFDPVHQNLSFGDIGSGFALDASVVRHEYAHFVVDQIYPIINFGQNGAMSEALADYFAGSSLNSGDIGGFTASALGGVGAFRSLDCALTPPCQVFPNNWQGLIHPDSRMLSQAWWEIRNELMKPGQLGPAAGQACADGLVWQALFFFPDSFHEMLKAMLLVTENSSTLLPICGANNSQRGIILARFGAHGVFEFPADQDVYEPNDGLQTATDISTSPIISARVFPVADLDYYALGAGPGPMTFTVNLPENPAAPGTYFAYSMKLIDRTHQIVAEASPPFDVNPTLSGFCPESNCLTNSPTAVLQYDNPASNQFYLLVSAPPGDESFVSRNNSTLFYALSSAFNQTGPVATNIISASFDNDTIGFSVRVSSYLTAQNYFFHSAQLRDHNLTTLSGTRTTDPGTFLAFVSSANALGITSGSLQLQPGFEGRFPAVGSVHLEVFASNPLGTVQSLGMSPAIPLTASRSAVKAWNNVFNPTRGQKATIRYEVQTPGNLSMKLYTRNGRHVKTLIDNSVPAGKGAIDWYGRNLSGSTVASGIYLLHVEGPGIRDTKKIIVVK